MNFNALACRERAGLAAAVVGDEMYAMGGYIGDTICNYNQIFDAKMGIWRPGPTLLAPRSGAVAQTIRNTVYLIGEMHVCICALSASRACAYVPYKRDACMHMYRISEMHVCICAL